MEKSEKTQTDDYDVLKLFGLKDLKTPLTKDEAKRILKKGADFQTLATLLSGRTTNTIN